MRTLALLTWAFIVLCVQGACEKDTAAPRAQRLATDEVEPRSDVPAGVLVSRFECDSIAPPKEVQQALKTAVRKTDSPMSPPHGIPPPCEYVSASGQSRWSFDLDCRQTAQKTGSALMLEYASNPESKAVLVGHSGVDHINSVLLFVDDDAPCYVRVMGPGAAHRLALARVIANHLRPGTAPTGWRTQ